MLAAAHRLRRKSDFRTAFRGLRVAQPRLVVHLSPEGSGHEGVSRAGFVVSRAVGPAVVRNAVQRRLRHLVRERLDRVPRGSLVVVRALPAAAKATSKELAADLDSALAQLSRRLADGRP